MQQAHSTNAATRSRALGAAKASRPAVTVYWRPGCSMCLRAKEFLEKLDIPFESLNVLDDSDARAELDAAGMRGLPVVRNGDRFAYVQSLGAINAVLGRDEKPSDGLDIPELLKRWDAVLEAGQRIVASFDDEIVLRRATLVRERPVRDLASHVFQIAEAFVVTMQSGEAAPRAFQNAARPDIVSRADLVAYVDKVVALYKKWLVEAGAAAVPATIPTYYGNHPARTVIERGVWHSAQHARQIDAVAVGIGAEHQLAPETYAGLPIPTRLWA